MIPLGGSRGVSLIEVTVALLVLSVGVLALAGLTSAVARMVQQGAGTTRAAALLAGRLESLLADPCGSRDGELRDGAFSVQWTTTPARGGVRVSVSVVASGGTPVRRTISRFVACGA